MRAIRSPHDHQNHHEPSHPRPADVLAGVRSGPVDDVKAASRSLRARRASQSRAWPGPPPGLRLGRRPVPGHRRARFAVTGSPPPVLPEPPQSRQVRRAISVPDCPRTPTTKARRDRRTFQPCPRHDGQFVASVFRVRRSCLQASRAYKPCPIPRRLSRRGIYHRNQITLHQRTDTTSAEGTTRDARSRQRVDRDPGFVLGATGDRRSPARSRHGPVLRARSSSTPGQARPRSAWRAAA